MVESECPWCESQIVLAAAADAEGHCAECLTTWRYEDDEVEVALALAA